MIKLIFFSLLSSVIILFVTVQSGYFNVEWATIQLNISKITPRGDSLLFNYTQQSNYIGFPDSRIQDFEEANRSAQVKYLISKLKNDSRYHEWDNKPVDIRIQLRELNASPQDTFTMHIRGSIKGFCSPQSARELTQLFLAKLEYGLAESKSAVE